MATILSKKPAHPSTLPYPEYPRDRAKYYFWKVATPPYLAVLATLNHVHLLHHRRQDFLLGKLLPERTVESFVIYLNGRGFYNHFIAWHDEGQLVSLRKFESFRRQWHVRIFADGEIRGHYEYTPEAHPKWHLNEVGMEDHPEDFREFFGDWVVRD